MLATAILSILWKTRQNILLNTQISVKVVFFFFFFNCITQLMELPQPGIEPVTPEMEVLS